MKKNQKNEKNFNQILKLFDEKCRKDNIWYSIAGKALLSWKTEQDYYKNNDFLDVFMSKESFEILLNKYPQSIIDSTTKNDYFYSNPIFFEPSIDVFIKINILVPTSIKRVEKFYKIKNLRRQYVGFWLSSQRKSLNWFFVKFLSLFFKPLIWKEIYSSICDEEKFNGFFIIEYLKNNINTHWIPMLSFDVDEVDFLNIKTFIIKENEFYLQKKFNWNTSKKLNLKSEKFIFSNAINKTKH